MSRLDENGFHIIGINDPGLLLLIKLWKHVLNKFQEPVDLAEFIVDGMTCNHCRMHVEHALNALDGVKAVVTLDPPVAAVEFSGPEVGLGELQKAVTERAGEYTLRAR